MEGGGKNDGEKSKERDKTTLCIQYHNQGGKMITCCEFINPRDMCVALKRVVEPKVGTETKISPRPYNRLKPDETDWWLVPSSDWPAYKHGKFFFDWGGADSLLVGLYIEKGLDPEVSIAYPSAKGQRYIMNSEWIWHQFLSDFKSGRIESLTKLIAEQLPIPIEFRIDGGYVDEPGSFDPYSTLLKFDKVLLRWEKDKNSFSIIESKMDVKVLLELENVKNFADLYQFLLKMNENKWLWLNVFIAVRLRNKNWESIPENDRELWDEELIWNRWLKHWLPWFY